MFIDSILKTKGSNVISVTAQSTIGELISVLAANNVGAVVVTDAERMVGIISERDIVRHLAGSAEGFRSRPVSSLMTRNPTTCAPTDTVEAAINRMSSGRFRHLPVMDNGELVGIVSMGDLVKRKIEQAEQEAGELREYIAS